MSAEPALAQLLNLPHWSDGLFSVSAAGELQIDLPEHRPVALHRIVRHCADQGLGTPLLLRFPQILALRARALQQAFAQALARAETNAGYRVIYPIKVNQQHSVVTALARAGQSTGLEAGSKAELLAVMAHAQPGSPIVCNGYKDREYIELACTAREMGLLPVLVIEQASEWSLIHPVLATNPNHPWLGLRLRLRSIGYGKWQNTGGAKAKFGLSASGVLELLGRIEAAGLLQQLRLLHFHMGSQISNLRDIQRGVREAARFLVECHRAGAPVQVMDVGGGLGVDYEGAQARSPCSMNYGFDQYAWAIVHALHQACQQAGLPMPEIWSESGRALTAHHAVLVTRAHSLARIQAREHPQDDPIARLAGELHRRPPEELYHEGEALLDEAHDQFIHGTMDLPTWAGIENSHRHLSLLLLQHLRPDNQRQRPILETLRERMADKLFLNFSVFRSIPDSWAIEQLFPITPLQGLHRHPTSHAMVEDLTCDSDGRVDAFPLSRGIESTLPLPDHDHNPGGLYGIFLVGAYQEVLGDNHNLFGLPHAVDVELNADTFYLRRVQHGDSREKVLAEVGHSRQSLEAGWQEKLHGMDQRRRQAILQRLDQALASYTYLDCTAP